jgi:hypothetical protein
MILTVGLLLAAPFLAPGPARAQVAPENARAAAAGRLAIDVGVEHILQPTGEVPRNRLTTPRSVVRNFGSDPASFWTYFSIGTIYSDSVMVTGLGPATAETLNFTDWTPAFPGNFVVTSFTQLAGDVNPANDTADTLITVVTRDLSISAIISPPDTVDTGEVFMPAVRVSCFGSDPHPGAWCILTIDGQAPESTETGPLSPGGVTDVEFATRSYSEPGGRVAFWQLRVYDMNPANDTARRRFFVRGGDIIDVGAAAILSPVGSVAESSTVTARAVAANYGAAAADIEMAFIILNGAGGEVFRGEASRSVPGRSEDTLEFGDWFAAPGGNYTTLFAVATGGDMNPDNDTARLSLRVTTRPPDVGVAGIVAPAGSAQEGIITPRARIANYGTTAETFRAVFNITRDGNPIYTDTITVTDLPPGAALTKSFLPWSAVIGSYVARCSTMLATDGNRSNDTLSRAFQVGPYVPDPGWDERAAVPTAPGGKLVKGGGSLTFIDGAEGLQIFALKGNKSSDFYRYFAAGDSWTPLTPVPPGSKPAEKGARLCADGANHIYMTKGNNTAEFWRYSINDRSWQPLPDVPPGPSGKKVKGGCDMAYVVEDSVPWVYLLKGGKTDFFRFNVLTTTWDVTLPPAPIGIKPKWDKGSFLVYDGENAIYAHKANYYNKNVSPPQHEMWVYRPAARAWDPNPIRGMPLLGLHGGAIKNKKSKDGAAGVWYNGFIAALKGGNTQQFWKFFPDQDTWVELDTLPGNGSTNKKKRASSGADLVSPGDGSLFALKGNKTAEFWRFRFSGGIGVAEPPRPSPVTAGLVLRPNPARRAVALSLPGTGPVEVHIYDAAGRSLRNWRVDGAAGSRLDLEGIAPGIYLVQVTRAGRTSTAKLVLQ